MSRDPVGKTIVERMAAAHPDWSNEQIADRINVEYTDPVSELTRRVAADGAVITVMRTPAGVEMTCTACPTVSAGSFAERQEIEGDAAYHHAWHYPRREGQ